MNSNSESTFITQFAGTFCVRTLCVCTHTLTHAYSIAWDELGGLGAKQFWLVLHERRGTWYSCQVSALKVTQCLWNQETSQLLKNTQYCNLLKKHWTRQIMTPICITCQWFNPGLLCRDFPFSSCAHSFPKQIKNMRWLVSHPGWVTWLDPSATGKTLWKINERIWLFLE